MRVLLLGADDVVRLLPVADCMAAMAEAFRALACGGADAPMRSVLIPPDRRGVLAWMPAWLGGSAPVMGIKTISAFGRNLGTPYPSHQGAVLLFESAHGRPLAIVEAGAITEIRTAAVSALATHLLARPDAGDLALFGSGTQASAHLTALRAVRPLRRVRVWSRTPEHARRFAERESARHELPVEVAEDGSEAADGADLICTATAARAPVLLGQWIAPGTHINAIGASAPSFREVDTAAIQRSRLFVETRACALTDADDIRIPLRDGAIAEDHIAGELGEVLQGRAPGRTGREEITLFKSVGLGLEDVAAAHLAYVRALAANAGTWVEFGALRPE